MRTKNLLKLCGLVFLMVLNNSGLSAATGKKADCQNGATLLMKMSQWAKKNQAEELTDAAGGLKIAYSTIHSSNTLQIVRRDDQLSITVYGDFDYNVFLDFIRTVSQQNHKGLASYVVDLSHINKIDDVTLSVLRIMQSHASSNGATIYLISPQPSVGRVLTRIPLEEITEQVYKKDKDKTTINLGKEAKFVNGNVHLSPELTITKDNKQLNFYV